MEIGSQVCDQDGKDAWDVEECTQDHAVAHTSAGACSTPRSAPLNAALNRETTQLHPLPEASTHVAPAKSNPQIGRPSRRPMASSRKRGAPHEDGGSNVGGARGGGARAARAASMALPALEAQLEAVAAEIQHAEQLPRPGLSVADILELCKRVTRLQRAARAGARGASRAARDAAGKVAHLDEAAAELLHVRGALDSAFEHAHTAPGARDRAVPRQAQQLDACINPDAYSAALRPWLEAEAQEAQGRAREAWRTADAAAAELEQWSPAMVRAVDLFTHVVRLLVVKPSAQLQQAAEAPEEDGQGAEGEAQNGEETEQEEDELESAAVAAAERAKAA